jgi:release factor glutamine methyltransferase
MPDDPEAPDTAAPPRTVLEFLRRASTFLAARGSASARLDAEVLLAAVLATDRVGVYLRFDQPLAPAEVESYRALVRRRAAGEPVAYLTGRREFWSRDLAVTPAVLIPRPETELLVERLLAAVPDRAAPLRVLDLGTGSGALAVALAAELPSATVVALDVSRAAAAVAAANARACGVEDRVLLLAADWCTALRPEARFDVIVSNPPYVESGALDALPPEVRAEPRLALDGGADGLAAYRVLVPAAAPLLAPGGRLFVEVGVGQASAVAEICAAAGFGEAVCYDDLAGIARIVAAGARTAGEDVGVAV